jgi:alpha-D-ribose 1-methylphosphonate 5-phosphate C-P lyase
MKYRIDAAVKSASDGYGFNITNERGSSIVTFAYVDEPEAEMARALIQDAIINAVSITGYALPR